MIPFQQSLAADVRVCCPNGQTGRVRTPCAPWRLDILPTETESNPEGCQKVAGGRSGQMGNDHRITASDGRAPRRGARPQRYDLNRHVTTAQPFALEQRQSRAAAVTSLAPRPGCRTSSTSLPGGHRPTPPRRRPATFWQPSGLTGPKCPNCRGWTYVRGYGVLNDGAAQGPITGVP
jgi:hypothetical protein